MSKALLITSFLCLSSALVHMPENDCDYFSYGIQNGKDYIGIFRADQAELQKLSWKMEFNWRGSQKHLVRSSNLYPDRDEAYKNLESGFLSMVFVRLVNITDELPQLTLLQLNERTLCSNPKYSVDSYGLMTVQLSYSTKATIPVIQDTFKTTFPKLPLIKAKRERKRLRGF